MRRVARGGRLALRSDGPGIVEVEGFRCRDGGRPLRSDDDMRLVAGYTPGTELQGGGGTDQAAPAGVVGVVEQRREGNIDEIGIAVIGIAVGKGELRAFDDRMHELRALR